MLENIVASYMLGFTPKHMKLDRSSLQLTEIDSLSLIALSLQWYCNTFEIGYTWQSIIKHFSLAVWISISGSVIEIFWLLFFLFKNNISPLYSAVLRSKSHSMSSKKYKNFLHILKSFTKIVAPKVSSSIWNIALQFISIARWLTGVWHPAYEQLFPTLTMLPQDWHVAFIEILLIDSSVNKHSKASLLCNILTYFSLWCCINVLIGLFSPNVRYDDRSILCDIIVLESSTWMFVNTVDMK